MSTKAVGSGVEQIVAALLRREHPGAVVWSVDARSQRYGSDVLGLFDGIALTENGVILWQCKGFDTAPGVWGRTVDQLPQPSAVRYQFWSLHRERPAIFRVWTSTWLTGPLRRVWVEREVNG